MPTVVPVHTATPIAISSNKLMGIRTVPSIRVLRAIKCDVGITDILEEEEEKKKVELGMIILPVCFLPSGRMEESLH